MSWGQKLPKRATEGKLPSGAEVGHYFANYYQSPAPELAPKMLEGYVAANPDLKNWNIPALYFFARIAQLHPSTNREYEALFERVSSGQKALLLSVLMLSADEKTVEFLRSKLKDKKCAELWGNIGQAIQKGLPLEVKSLQRPVASSVDMDVRWGEFLLTGNAEVAIPIIDVLEWTDLLRQKLDDWLNGRLGMSPTVSEREQVQRRLFETAGISLDLEHNRVKTAEDLDYVSLVVNGTVTGEGLQKVAAALPFPLSNEEKQRIGEKAVAKWSLQSNAMQHQAILALCDNQAAKRTGRARLALLEIVGRGWSAGREYERAAKALHSYLEISSENKELQVLLDFAEAEMQLTALQNLSKDSAVKDGGNIPADFIQKTVAATRAARSYASKTLLNFYEGSEEGNVEWRADFVSPDKYHVQQAGWKANREKGDFDEWITLGQDHYDNLGLWTRLPAEAEVRKQRMGLNPLLRVGKFLTLMAGDLRPVPAEVLNFRQRRYLMVEYESKVPSEFGVWPEAVSQPGRFRIWVDWEHQQVAKGELEFCRARWEAREVEVATGVCRLRHRVSDRGASAGSRAKIAGLNS